MGMGIEEMVGGMLEIAFKPSLPVLLSENSR